MKKFLLILIISFYFISSFSFASAALVSCGPKINASGEDIGKACTFCDFLKTGSNVFNFAIYSIAIPLVVIMIIYGGFVIMTAGDSTDKVAQGRKIIQSSIIGVVIVLGAWLIISQVLAAIAMPNYKFEPSKIFTTGIKCS